MFEEINGRKHYKVRVDGGDPEFVPASPAMKVLTIHDNADGSMEAPIKAVEHNLKTLDGVTIKFTIPYEDNFTEEQEVEFNMELRNIEEIIGKTEVRENIEYLSQILEGVDYDVISIDNIMTFFNDTGEFLGAGETPEAKAVKEMKFAARAMCMSFLGEDFADESIADAEIIPTPDLFLVEEGKLRQEEGGFWLFTPGNRMYAIRYEKKGSDENGAEYDLRGYNLPNSMTAYVTIVLANLHLYNNLAKRYLEEVPYNEETESFETDFRVLLTPEL